MGTLGVPFLYQVEYLKMNCVFLDFSELTTMDMDLSNVLAQLQIEDKDILGMMLLDSLGLVVGMQGEVEMSSEGIIQNIAGMASKMMENDEYPVIIITTDTRKYLIKREDKITTAIVKKL